MNLTLQFGYKSGYYGMRNKGYHFVYYFLLEGTPLGSF